MAAAITIVSEITHYLALLNEQQQKAVLGMVKTFAREEDWWNDKKYMSEMDKRFSEMETGKVKSISIEELETNARLSYKKGKSKK